MQDPLAASARFQRAAECSRRRHSRTARCTANALCWPSPRSRAGPGLEYEHLACGLKRHIEQHGIGAISAEQLAVATKDDVRAFFGAKGPLPQEEERARLLREVSSRKRTYLSLHLETEQRHSSRSARSPLLETAALPHAIGACAARRWARCC